MNFFSEIDTSPASIAKSIIQEASMSALLGGIGYAVPWVAASFSSYLAVYLASAGFLMTIASCFVGSAILSIPLGLLHSQHMALLRYSSELFHISLVLTSVLSACLGAFILGVPLLPVAICASLVPLYVFSKKLVETLHNPQEDRPETTDNTAYLPN